MISRAIWYNKKMQIFLKISNCNRPTGSSNFVVFEKFTFSY